MKKILLCLMLLNFVFAQSQISSAVTSLKNSIPLILLITTSTFVFSGLAFAIGKILNMGSIKAWAKDQIYESFLSLFIALITIFFLENFFLNYNFNTLLSSSKLLPQQCKEKVDLFEISECELEYFFNKISDLLWDIFSIDIFLKVFSTCSSSGSFNFFVLEVGWKLPFLSSFLTDLSDALFNLYRLLLIAFVLNSFQVYLLLAAPYIFLIFFPAGVVLRSFGLTRKVGGSLIAISIGLSIVFPTLVAVGYGYILSSYSFAFPSIKAFFATWISSIVSLIASWLNLGAGLQFIIFFIGFIPIIISLFNLLSKLLFGDVSLLALPVLGLLVVPYIIFDVLENFIRGFSSQIGQEVSVLAWMGRLL
jgi:hypothetical protein